MRRAAPRCGETTTTAAPTQPSTLTLEALHTMRVRGRTAMPRTADREETVCMLPSCCTAVVLGAFRYSKLKGPGPAASSGRDAERRE
jgi:hypothetical protein